MVRQHDTYLKRSLNLVNESIFSPSKGYSIQWLIILINIKVGKILKLMYLIY